MYPNNLIYAGFGIVATKRKQPFLSTPLPGARVLTPDVVYANSLLAA